MCRACRRSKFRPVISNTCVQAWDHVPNRAEADRLENQAVVLTVPASFDDVARNLTLLAAKEAGLKNVTLLEEPQAAFYCWLGLSDPKEVTRMSPGMRCLVVDVGGGTSDFSLIRAAEETGELTFIREAVGDHLLLGGDNMDLALARQVEGRSAAGRQTGCGPVRHVGAILPAGEGDAAVAEASRARSPSPFRDVADRSSVDRCTRRSRADDVRQAILEGFFPIRRTRR